MDGSPSILEATIRKTSRDVVGLDMRGEELAKGRLGLSWNILEQDDGGSIQIVYAGPPGATVHLEGVIEGQRSIERYDFSAMPRSASEMYARAARSPGGGSSCLRP